MQSQLSKISTSTVTSSQTILWWRYTADTRYSPGWRLDWEIKFIRCGETGDINLTSANTLRLRYIDINYSLVSSKLEYWRPGGFYKLLKETWTVFTVRWTSDSGLRWGWCPVLDHLTRFPRKNDGWSVITDAGESWFAWYRGRRGEGRVTIDFQ